jgi:uncharacterized protein
MKRNLFAIPVQDKWLVHAPLHELTALVNAPVLACLAREDSAHDPADVTELRRILTGPPIHTPKVKDGEFDPQFLAIVTTRGCNINCVYCDFGGPTSAKVHMDPALAVEAIDWMADRLVAHGRDEFFLHFFGGEPFISGELVEIIVHRTRAVCAERGLRPHFDVSTNGVFNEARATWVGDYFDSVVLSFDGPPEFQNRNRPANGGRPTYDAVMKTAARLSRSAVELCLRVCVTGESASHMPEITRWMAETFRPAVINFEPLTENDLTARVQLPAADPYEFARKWIESKRVAESLGVRLVYSATDAAEPRLSSCPVGSDTVVVTPDGTVNGCYLQPTDWLKHRMDMRLGRIEVGGGVTLDPAQVEHVRQLIVEKPRCEGCFCQWSCAGGCHVSNTYRGCSEDYVAFCLQTRLITACILLEDLGRADLVDALLADEAAMRRLATHSWDPLGAGRPAAAPAVVAP